MGKKEAENIHHAIDSIYKIYPFLKTNIAYNQHSYGIFSNVTLCKRNNKVSINEHNIRDITIILKSNEIATIIIDNNEPINLQISSIDYYGYITGELPCTPLGLIYEMTKLAIIKTSMGEIRIAESEGFFKTSYSFYIKIKDNEIAIGAWNCFLPREKSLEDLSKLL